VATLLETSIAIGTPWTLAGAVPGLPVRTTGPVSAVAAPVGPTTPTGAIALATPWNAADVRLPARASSLPSLAVGPVFPAPRQPSEVLA
jgi:hypothetical protein